MGRLVAARGVQSVVQRRPIGAAERFAVEGQHDLRLGAGVGGAGRVAFRFAELDGVGIRHQVPEEVGAVGAGLGAVVRRHRADDGVYIHFDHEALIGILALEAQRAGTIVIGEDLGTLEPWVSDYLNQRGLLGTVVALFEKDGDGGPQAPENYRADALVSVTVHDLPPTAPFLSGEHIDAREELGLIVGDVQQVRAAASADLERLAAYLLQRGWMPEEWEEDDLVAGIHRLAMHSPALLTAVSLTDAVGDRRSQNHPGTSTEYPNWRIPLTDKAGAVVLLDDIFESERLQRLLETVRSARR